MSEFLANLLRAASATLSLACIAAGLWLAGVGLAADATRDELARNIRARWERVQVSGLPARDKQVEARKLRAIWRERTWGMMWRWYLLRPAEAWTRVQWALPVLRFPFDLSPEGSRSPHRWQARRVYLHQGSFIAAGVILALMVEFLAFPALRARLARWLAEVDDEALGRARELPKGDGFVLARGVRTDPSRGNPHVLTIGPSGSGKSSCQVIPSLLSLPDDCAAICTDPKGELAARCAPWLRERGHEVIVLDPMGGLGHGWDPLHECPDTDAAAKLARTVLAASEVGGDDTWINMSWPLLSAYCIEAWSRGRTINGALDMLFADQASGQSLRHPAALERHGMFSAASASGGTIGSILGTIQGAAAPWRLRAVRRWTEAERSFEFGQLAGGTVVFLLTGSGDAKSLAGIQHVFWSLLFSRLAEGGLGRVRLMIDEFANLGRLEGVAEGLNLLRSAGVAIHAMIQNTAQLSAVYGREEGEVLRESFGTLCFLAGLRGDAELAARLIGQREDVRESYSTQDERMRAQYAQQQRDALQARAIRQLRDGEALIVSHNHRPVIARLQPYYRSRLARRIPAPVRGDWRQCAPAGQAWLEQEFGKLPEPPEPAPAQGEARPAGHGLFGLRDAEAER